MRLNETRILSINYLVISMLLPVYAFYYDLYDAQSALHSDVTTVSFIIV